MKKNIVSKILLLTFSFLLFISTSSPVFAENIEVETKGEPNVKYSYSDCVSEEYVNKYDTSNSHTNTWSRTLESTTETGLDASIAAIIAAQTGDSIRVSVGAYVHEATTVSCTLTFSKTYTERVHRTVYNTYHNYYEIRTYIPTGETVKVLIKKEFISSRFVDEPY